MSVKLRKYQGGDDWEVDIRVQLPDGTVVRERKKAPVTGRTAVLRWAEARERVLVVNGKPARKKVEARSTLAPPWSAPPRVEPVRLGAGVSDLKSS